MSRLTIGRWVVDPAADTLALDGRTVKLQPRTMRLLVALAERPDEVCSSQDLHERVWAGVVVTDQSLYQAIGELRAVLKADDAAGEFIATVPRKGYRLVAPVRRVLLAATPAVPSAPQAPAARKVAVLPFRDLGLPQALSFLPETLLGGLVLELSRQPGLTTIARGTMLSYRGLQSSPRRVAEELQVRYVVDGAISAMGERLSISCDLIDAAGDAVLASESIDVPAADWSDLAQRVVGRLVRVWRLEVLDHSARQAVAGGPGHADALELAMRAWVELYCRPQNRETNDRAWAWAAEAVRHDASLGAAWNVLAFCEFRAVQYDWQDPRTDTRLADALAHAERATALSPSDPDAHYTLGLVLLISGDYVRARATLHHCLEISTSYAPAWGLLALVVNAEGHPEQAFELAERALALSPREPLRAVWHWGEACAASMLGREEEALAYAARGIAANPDFPSCYLVAVVAARRLGRHVEAARFVSVLQTTAFRSIERVRQRVNAFSQHEPWASAFLADLHAAGLPER
ncbi:winged helix-turn-helix domain-containing protein [Piscinibacter sakaiensis]|uniref:winged helix-turn-helix domain-containing protein n=1 Tax=Piscinibacter sakaiensis TaxID=1547922 RepID=UPI0006B57201|nr:winged helix-turn-helix domain-containing protein [Piscinibacter sakaiensis]